MIPFSTAYATASRMRSQHLHACDSESLELQIGDRRLDHARLHAQLDERFDVGSHSAREAPDLGRQAGVGDQLDGVPVVLRHAGEPGLDALDARVGEPARDLELLLRVEDDADGLFAVAERRVVEADLRLEGKRIVDFAGPDAHRKSSGNVPSRSGPSLVIRKLSSRRRPPPPSQ